MLTLPPGQKAEVGFDDPNEEIGSLQRIGSQATQIGASRKVINPSEHGLVLLN